MLNSSRCAGLGVFALRRNGLRCIESLPKMPLTLLLIQYIIVFAGTSPGFRRQRCTEPSSSSKSRVLFAA